MCVRRNVLNAERLIYFHNVFSVLGTFDSCCTSGNVFDAIFRFSSVPFYKIVVPTVDTLRYDFLVSTLVKANRPVLLTGPVGTGKTSVAQTALEKLDPKIFSILTINMSAQVTVALFCLLICSSF